MLKQLSLTYADLRFFELIDEDTQAHILLAAMRYSFDIDYSLSEHENRVFEAFLKPLLTVKINRAKAGRIGGKSRQNASKVSNKTQANTQTKLTDTQPFVEVFQETAENSSNKAKEKTENEPLPLTSPIEDKDKKEKEKEKGTSVGKDKTESKARSTSVSLRRMTQLEAREWLKAKLLPYKESGTYTAEMLNDFYRYWAEPVNEDDLTSKLKFQLQPTWQTSGRLRTWAGNNKNRYGF